MASNSAKTGPGQQPTLPLILDELKSASHHNLASLPDRRGTKTAQSTPMHSRESSAVRGRAADLSTLAPAIPTRRGHSGSKSPDVSTGRPAGYDVGLERRPSNSYGHHRQTSIVHGMQHSRNTSMAGSTSSTSPLSPELIASLGRSGSDDASIPSKMEQLETHPIHSSPAGLASSYAMQGTLSTIQDTDADERLDGSPASLVHKRMNSGGKARRERSHSRSHSKHHSESKTVGEYALHHLFNSVELPTLITEAITRQLTQKYNSLLGRQTVRSTRLS